MEKQITQKLIGNIIIDLCQNNKSIVFKKAWCSKERIIRFTSDYLDSIFGVTRLNKGNWSNGRRMMYEIHNEIDDFYIQCALDYSNILSKQNEIFMMIIDKFQGYFEDDFYIIKKWNYKKASLNSEKIQHLLDNFFKEELAIFENEFINHINRVDQVNDNYDDELTEGKIIELYTQKYERNKVARLKCLQHYGYKCSICGFDYSKTYGKDFANIIEVHHIKPLSEIKSDYVVDPIKDLIPLCPNCHRAIHSNKDRVFKPEELAKIINSKTD